ncbi:peptidase S8/S53 domain-containing protein [Cantharellus anzutake]|uniref:peptidase S8/S53 domain-containing protein n=1 Tax=Cantharellus anzutake TaxID=1750568 RepID=UPI001906518D|nr:peptidase S8/S53 domain-containing protein [Cantharellus anzutake]KAF8331722.1 peptidase S8/S53 domain-containing protein [Cantharellus anzutake]
MKFSTVVILIIIFTSTTPMALAASVRIRMPKGPVKPDSYIVMLKSSTNMEDHIKSITQISARSPGSEFSITHRYGMLNGYSAHATGTSLARILICPEVSYVEADGTTSIGYDLHGYDLHGYDHHERDATEHDNDGIKMEDNLVELKERADGRIVTVYSLDSGANLHHICFVSDEAQFSWGHTVTGTHGVDTFGAGTYIAAKAVGEGFSLPSLANLRVVKITEDDEVAASDLIEGIEWVYTDSIESVAPQQRGSPIIMICCHFLDYLAINEAVSWVINLGLHVVVCAGDHGVDAGQFGPANVIGAITVGAVSASAATHQYVISHSNYGKVISVFAPGINIQSAWNGPGLDALMTLSGTAPATAWVVSMLACILRRYGWMSPAELREALREHARDVVTGQPPGSDTPGLLATMWW